MFSFFKNFFGQTGNLLKLMPRVRGKIKANAPLSKMTWLGVGGNADILFTPADESDLSWFLSAKPNLPITVIGGGSNLLIRDGGIPGIVIHLDSYFCQMSVEKTTIRCKGGAKNTELAKTALEAGLAGFEFLNGIPGTIGGSVRMNAGANGSEIKDILLELTVIEGSGKKIVLTRDEISFEYRHTPLPDNWIFTEMVFQGNPSTKEEIQKVMRDFKESRENNQPTGVRTAGSMFKNPVGLKAWQLIDKAGCRGLKVGGAVVSEKHCNFFINTGKATARDFELLAKEVQRRVYETSEIMLEWEVRRIGVKSKRFSSFGGRK